MQTYRIILKDGISFEIKVTSPVSHSASRDYVTGEAYYEFSEGQKVIASSVVAIIKLNTIESN